MTTYCARLPLMAAATPICCRAPGDEVRKIAPRCRCTTWWKLANITPRRRCRALVSRAGQVSAAIDAGAAGAISGSAIVKIIERHLDEPQTMLDELKAFVRA